MGVVDAVGWACALWGHCIQNDQAEQWISIRFCIKFCIEHSPVETIWMIQKTTAMSNWWLQLHHGKVPAHASCLVQSFCVKCQITHVTRALYSSDLAPCDFWLFWKLKSLLKVERFQTISEIQENMTGQLMEVGRTVFQGAYSEGGRGIIVLCTEFLVLCAFFVKCFYFSFYLAGYLLDKTWCEGHSQQIPWSWAHSHISFTAEKWKSLGRCHLV